MNIIVLMKLAANPEKGYMKESGVVDREKSEPITNPYDLNALEEALKIKKQWGAKITIISMGPNNPAMENMLRDALARGADQAILLTDRKLGGSDTRATAYALAKAIRKIGHFDIVFAGMQAIDGDTAQVGPQVAENLNIPQITFCEEIKVENNKITAKRIIEGGYERIKTSLPALLTITHTANNPKLPTLREILRAKKTEILIWGAKDIKADENKIGLDGSPTKVKRIHWVQRKEGGCALAQGETLEEKIKDLLRKLKEDGVGLPKRGD